MYPIDAVSLIGNISTNVSTSSTFQQETLSQWMSVPTSEAPIEHNPLHGYTCACVPQDHANALLDSNLIS